MHIIITGAGIGGISTALACLKAGFEVTLLEQAKALKEVGAGVQISSNGSAALRELGLIDAVDAIAVKSQSFHMLRFETGELIADFPLGESAKARYGETFYQIHRADLLEILAGALPDGVLRTSARVEDIRQDTTGVTAVLAGGEEVRGDLLVGADGIHSAVRKSLGISEEPTFSGRLAWRALVPAERIAECNFEERFYGNSGQNRMIWAYWVRPKKLFNFGGIVPAADSRRESWTDTGDLEAMRESFRGANPRLQILIDAIDEAFITGLYDRESLDRWSFGRVTLLGDAAHAMLPFLAQGACQSLEDSIVLAECLKRHGAGAIEEALRDYEIRRRPRTTKVQAAARAASIFWLEQDPEQVRARDGRLRGLFQIDPLTSTMWNWLYSYNPVEQGKAAEIVPDKRGIRRQYEEDSPEQKRAWNMWHDLFSNADEAGGLIGLRRGYDRFFGQWQPADDTSVTEVPVGEARGLWVEPAGVDRKRAILHFHGGGFCFGSAKCSVEYADRLARAADAKCLALEYRLAPEHPFPAALDDAVAAYEMLLEHHRPEDILLSGESAGVSLAVATAMKLRDAGVALPAGIIGLSPFVDCTLTNESIDRRDGEDPIVERDALAYMVSGYFQEHSPADPLVSPVYGDFEGLPPLLIQAGEKEVLVEEATRLAECARAAGVPVSLELYDERLHIFPMFPFLPNAEAALASVSQFTADLREAGNAIPPARRDIDSEDRRHA